MTPEAVPTFSEDELREWESRLRSGRLFGPAYVVRESPNDTDLWPNGRPDTRARDHDDWFDRNERKRRQVAHFEAQRARTAALHRLVQEYRQ